MGRLGDCKKLGGGGPRPRRCGCNTTSGYPIAEAAMRCCPGYTETLSLLERASGSITMLCRHPATVAPSCADAAMPMCLCPGLPTGTHSAPVARFPSHHPTLPSSSLRWLCRSCSAQDRWVFMTPSRRRLSWSKSSTSRYCAPRWAGRGGRGGQVNGDVMCRWYAGRVGCGGRWKGHGAGWFGAVEQRCHAEGLQVF